MRKLLAVAISLLSIVFSFTTYQKSPPPSDEVRGKSGFWQIVKQNNIWWFRSPEGHLEFVTSVQGVLPYQYGIQKPDFVSSDYHGDLNLWAEVTAGRAKNYGFKAIGPWNDSSIDAYMPYFRDLNILKCTNLSIDSPDWEKSIKDAIREQIEPLKNDKNLIGYFTDNEINWTQNAPYAEKYFSITSKLIKRFDPNHLILGVRFNKRAPLSVLYASKGKVDAHSLNQYGGAYKNMIRDLYTICDTPVIISEFSYFCSPNPSGDKNLNWDSGGYVDTLANRARNYREFVNGLSSCSFVIGVGWFRWNDEPPSGREMDGEDLNCGIVDIYDTPYQDMVDAVRSTSGNVNLNHQYSDDNQDAPVWKIDPITY